MKKNYHTIVIGSGAAGLVVAVGLAKASKSVLLIEKKHFGGDCTNFGCIPSKSLIASANVAHLAKKGEALGLDIQAKVGTHHVFTRIQKIVSSIAKHEDEKALLSMGIDVIKGHARFSSKNTISVDDGDSFSAKHIVIASGSKPRVPKIPGLCETPYPNQRIGFFTKKAFLPRLHLLVEDRLAVRWPRLFPD